MVPHKDAVRQWWCVVVDAFWATLTSGWGFLSVVHLPRSPSSRAESVGVLWSASASPAESLGKK